jgi:uncharacterized protein
MLTSSSPNRLINSTSPYLLQHAHNPVDWYEWSDEALAKAKELNKPILVSIGYSSCHWCHVMEREVFEKKDIADIMNNYLICIKVDREERPDIDSIYMEAVQALGVHGGWPLNVFLTPDQKPFYGGTYFPPDQWVNVLHGLNKAFTERRNEVETSAEELTKALAQQDTSHYKKVYAFESLHADLDKMYKKLAGAFDKSWGGLDKAPKFVMPSVWLWLLRYYYLTGNEEALAQINLTLRRIGWGGIYDQVGGGFARYSVDGYWFVPHFEKMLYDNAQLLSLYAEAYAVTKDHLFKTIVAETFDWLQGEMMHAEGGFYSALDADSEGVEGKFYIWKQGDIDEILGADAEIFKDFFNIKNEGNWEHGENVLIRTQPDDVFLKKHNLTKKDWNVRLRMMKDKLLEVRDKRIKPGLDDKIITSWNAMMAVGLTDAYRYLQDQRYLDAALKNITFLETRLMDGTTIYRSYKSKRSTTKAFLDDYAYVIQAYIKLYQVTFTESWLDKAKHLTEHVIKNFLDKEDGFFFYTSNESESLIARRKEIFDNVIPASNSVMIQNLFQLGTILDHEEWKQLAEAITTPISHLIVEEPNYMSNWGIAYMEIKKGLHEVVIAGNTDSNLFEHYLPLSVWMKADEKSTLPLTKDKRSIDGKPTIYVCFDKTCLRPVHEVSEAIAEIQRANILHGDK